VNPHHNQARETEISLRGALVKSGESRTLTSSDIHARNSFANPHALEPKTAPVNANRLELDLSHKKAPKAQIGSADFELFVPFCG
jgi:alpha-L-arabinofuranosidase